MPTTFRADLREAAYDLLEGFRAANPTLLAHVDRARPPSLSPPCAFVGGFRETVSRTQGTRGRSIVVELWIVQGQSDNAESAARNDVVVDSFRDYCEDFIHAAGGSTLNQTFDAEDVELEHRGPNGPVFYVATRINFVGDIREGRQSLTI